MKSFSVFALFVLMMVILSPFGVQASDAVGAAELKLINSVFIGGIGFSIGFIVAVMGAYAFATGDAKRGILLVVLGVTITLLPMLFTSIHFLVCQGASALFGAKCGS